MIKERKYTKSIESLLIVSVFFLPLFQVVSLICWIVMFVMALLEGGTSAKLRTLADRPMFLLFFLLYLLYAIGMLWTENIALGIQDLQIKIPLLLFPVLFSLIEISETTLQKVRKGLVYGCLTSLIYCFVISSIHFNRNHDIGNFFYTGFSHLMHPTYYTMFINLAVLMLLDGWLKGVQISTREKIGNSILLLIFISALIILSARLAMVAAFFTMTLFVVLESWKQKNIQKLLPLMVLGALVTLSLSWFFIHLNNRFAQIADVIEKKADPTALKDTVNNISYNSTTIRIGLLKNGIAIFKEHPIIGVGTGDVIPESVKRLNDQGLHILALKSNGAHNQYLQTAVTLGIFGFIVLLLCICWPLFEFVKAKEYLFAAFMMIVFINAIGDTVLRASSLYFFTLFGCFFYQFHRKISLKKM